MNKSIQEAAGQAQAENHDRREIERLTAALAERSARAAEVETCLREWLSAYRPGVPLGTLAHVITRARKLMSPPSEEEPPTVPPQRARAAWAEIDAAIDGVVAVADTLGPCAFERATTRLLGTLAKHRATLGPPESASPREQTSADLLATVPAKERERIAESAKRWANIAADLARSKAITDEGATENNADKTWRIAGNEAYHVTVSREVAAYRAQHTPAERVTEEELAEIEERTSGPGPLAGDGPSLKRLAAEVRARRNDAEIAAGECRVAIPPPGTDVARLLIANRLMRGELSALRAELAVRPARDDLTAMDVDLARAVRDTLGETTHHGVIERLEELLDVEKEHRAMIAVVRAVDASRPALTEEEARAWVVCNGWTDGDGRHAPIVSALLALSRGDIPADVRGTR